MVRVRYSIYDGDAGVDSSLSFEGICDVALSWAKSVKIWMLGDDDDEYDNSNGNGVGGEFREFFM